MLRQGNWDVMLCDTSGETVLARPWTAEGKASSASAESPSGRGSVPPVAVAEDQRPQVWVHEGNVEWHLWRIHAKSLQHAGMDKTWSEVQRQLYGCTQNLCRTYVVSCGCAENRGKNKRARVGQPGVGSAASGSPRTAASSGTPTAAGGALEARRTAAQPARPVARHCVQRPLARTLPAAASDAPFEWPSYEELQAAGSSARGVRPRPPKQPTDSAPSSDDNPYRRFFADFPTEGPPDRKSPDIPPR